MSVKISYDNFSGVPNQKAIKVNKKRNPVDKTDIRISDLFKNDLFAASRNLKDTTFKLYIYLISNQEEYVSGLSKIDVMNKIGISESSYKRAMKELEEKGYLVYTGMSAEDSHGMKLPLYNFFAIPSVGSI